jgi:hypothetical protein
MKGNPTADEVRQAATGATTVSQVGRLLGLCTTTLAGRTGRMLRALVPELDGLVKANRPPKVPRPPRPARARAPFCREVRGNPYREGSMYHTLFREGNAKSWEKPDLVARVSRLTKKSTRCITFALAVLGNPHQRSNLGRSCFLRDGKGRVQLIALPGRRGSK